MAGAINIGTMGITGTIIVTNDYGEGGVVERAGNAEETWNQRARTENDPRSFVYANFFGVKARSRLQLAGNPVIVFGSKRLCRHS